MEQWTDMTWIFLVTRPIVTISTSLEVLSGNNIEHYDS